MENFTQPTRMEISKELNNFFELLFALLKSTESFSCFEKKMSPIALLFPKLFIAEDGVTEISKTSISEYPSTVNDLTGPKHC